MKTRAADTLALIALGCGVAILGFASEPSWLVHILAHILVGLSILIFTLTAYIYEYQRRIDLQIIQEIKSVTYNGGNQRLKAVTAARLILSLLGLTTSFVFLSQQFPSLSLVFCSVLIILPIVAAIALRCCCEKLMDQRFLRSVDQRRNSARSPSNAATPLLKQRGPHPNVESPTPAPTGCPRTTL